MPPRSRVSCNAVECDECSGRQCDRRCAAGVDPAIHRQRNATSDTPLCAVTFPIRRGSRHAWAGCCRRSRRNDPFRPLDRCGGPAWRELRDPEAVAVPLVRHHDAAGMAGSRFHVGPLRMMSMKSITRRHVRAWGRRSVDCLFSRWPGSPAHRPSFAVRSACGAHRKRLCEQDFTQPSGSRLRKSDQHCQRRGRMFPRLLCCPTCLGSPGQKRLGRRDRRCPSVVGPLSGTS